MTTDKLRCELVINGEVVDPYVPHYWWPAEPVTVTEPPDWTRWTQLGATEDAPPPAFRRRRG